MATASAYQPIELGNYTQINGKTIKVYGTRRPINQSGTADEYAYQLHKRGYEIRRNIMCKCKPCRCVDCDCE